MLVQTQQRLWQAFSKLKAVRPAPEMVLITGDFIHDGYYSLHWETLTHGAANNYKLVASMLFDLGIPVAVAFGNHDYKASLFSTEGLHAGSMLSRSASS